MSRSTDEIIDAIRSAKVAKEMEQKASRDAIEAQLQKQARQKQAALDDFKQLTSLLETAVSSTNKKLEGLELEMQFGPTGEAAPGDQLPNYHLRFKPVPQGVKGIVATFVPFIEGSTQVRFKRINDTSTLDERTYNTAAFTSGQADVVVNKFLDLATS